MNAYEAMFIVKPTLDDETIAQTLEKYSQQLQTSGAEVTQADNWGRKRLAYELNGLKEGVYLVLKFKGPPQTAQELDRVLKLSDDVLKIMIVSKN